MGAAECEGEGGSRGGKSATWWVGRSSGNEVGGCGEGITAGLLGEAGSEVPRSGRGVADVGGGAVDARGMVEDNGGGGKGSRAGGGVDCASYGGRGNESWGGDLAVMRGARGR